MKGLQVLVATMRQKDFSLIGKMNIRTDVVFANQAEEASYSSEIYDFGTAETVTTNTVGVGINRNIALLYAKGDYLLFSDDDLRYVDNYKEIVLNAFKQLPEADGIIFNIETIGNQMGRRKNIGIRRIKWYNALNYGAVRLAVKRVSIKRENIMFSTNFGGGTGFSSGEDTLIICDMLKKGLKLYTYPETIAVVDQSDSTWFKGYNKKYYYDKGVLFAAISKKAAKLLCLQDIIRHRNYKKSGLTFFEAYGLMKKGIKGFKTLTEFSEGTD